MAEGAMKHLRLVFVCAFVSVAGVARAQVENTGVLDQALKQYRTAAESWQSAGQNAGTTLFWSLATISLVWTMGQLALRRAELGEFFGELIRYLLFTGFWAWMLANGPTHAQLIMESMIKLAGGASGQNMTSPSGVLDVGFHVVDRALTQSTILSPLDSAIGIVLALVILVVLALVGVNMLVTLIACWIVAYGGLIVLGFGGSRWTSDMAINYYRMVLSLGLQVLAMVLLVGIGESFLRSYFSALETDVSLHEQAVLLVVSIVLLATVNRVPALLGTLASGSSPQYALGSGAGAGAALSTVSAAGALAATASRPALEGAGHLARTAAAAAVGGAGAAAMSLLDGFRSRDGERSASAGGGSVFPASAISTVAPHGEVHGEGRSSTPGLGGSNEALPSAEAAQREPDSGSPEADLRSADERGEVESGHSGAGAVEDELRAHSASVEPQDNHGAAGSDSAERPERSAFSSSVDAQGADTNASGNGTKASMSASVQDARQDGASPSPIDRSARAAGSDAVSGSSPAGTFASPVPNTSAPAHGSSLSVTPPLGLAGQASSSTTTRHPGTALTSALAGATSRAAVTSLDLPFANAAVGDDDTAVPRPSPAPSPVTASERAQLPAAYSVQAAVDIEAEIAAFRDKE